MMKRCGSGNSLNRLHVFVSKNLYKHESCSAVCMQSCPYHLEMGRMSDYNIRPKPKVWAGSPNGPSLISSFIHSLELIAMIATDSHVCCWRQWFYSISSYQFDNLWWCTAAPVRCSIRPSCCWSSTRSPSCSLWWNSNISDSCRCVCVCVYIHVVVRTNFRKNLVLRGYGKLRGSIAYFLTTRSSHMNVEAANDVDPKY